jgi:hypothetical protein
MSPEPQLRSYDVSKLRESNETLDSLGAKVYFLDGWEFFCLLFGNLDFFKNQDQGSWYSACQVGESRSDRFNKLIRNSGLGSTSRIQKSEDPSAQGMTLWDMFFKIAAGNVKHGMLFPEGFQAGFNRVVFFIREGDVKRSQITRLITNSLSEAERDNIAKPGELLFFIVMADEDEIANLVNFVDSSLKKSLPSKDIAEMIAQQFNPQNGIVNFNYQVDSD